MDIGSLINKNVVSAHVVSSTKREAIAEIVGYASSRKGLRDPDQVLHAVLRREGALKTALGGGVAIPHARLPNLREPIVFIATAKQGIPWGAPDGQPVDVIILFLTPAAATDVHLKILSIIGDLLRQRTVLNDIRAARTDGELLKAITSHGKRRDAFVPLSKEEICEELETTRQGLSESEAHHRRQINGPNRLESVRSESLLRKFLGNLVNLLALLMWVGAALAYAIGMRQVALAILIVIFVNALFSFWQEFRAERAIEALKGLIPSYANVLRDGKTTRIPSEELVPGDIVELEEGDSVAADARLIHADELRVDNSAFSGESKPVYKMAEMPNQGSDRRFLWIEIPVLVFAGTSVISGSGTAVVTATGMRTEIGQIASLTQSIKITQSPLQEEIGRLTRVIALISVAMGLGFFLIGTAFTKMDLTASAIFAIGIILANVPEGLLPTVSLALAMAVQRMAKQGALIKKLSSVETLGSTNVICTDKTGTLTTNEMTTTDMWVGGRSLHISGVGYEPSGNFSGTNGTIDQEALHSSEFDLFIKTAVLCNTATLTKPGPKVPYWTITGDPTEGALLVLARKSGADIESLRADYPELKRFPFEPVRKRMSSVRLFEDKHAVVLVKGAPNELLDLCDTVLVGGQQRDLRETMRTEIRSEVDRLASEGLRVLGFAFRPADSESVRSLSSEQAERSLTFLGVTGMNDPPRSGVAQAVEKCKRAGIRIIMVTGDYQLTALSVARKLDLMPAGRSTVISGAELSEMTDDELQSRLANEEVVFARASPEHKLRVVTALKEMGNIVAVTGDGVNDAPALKKADIGVAMGLRGTDVARESAEMILTDDNFASIVSAIEEGRAVFANVKKFITYIFAHLVPEAVPFILYVLLKIPAPITALQILAIDLGTETIPALALGIERPEPGIMEVPPRDRKQGIINGFLLFRGYVYLGLLNTVAVLGAYFTTLLHGGWRFGQQLELSVTAFTNPLHIKAATMVFAGIVVMQIANVFSCRSERLSAFRIGFWSNRLIVVGIAFELAFTALLVYTPLFQPVFTTLGLGWSDWALLFALMLAIFMLEEIRKKAIELWRSKKRIRQ